MTKTIEKSFVLGGSVEKALSGDYELKVLPVLREAWKFTVANFLSFTPAIVMLLIVQFSIFYIALTMQIGDPSRLMDMLLNPDAFDPAIIQAIVVANFSYEVISVPIYAGVCLMGMSHAAGLKTSSRQIFKGLQFTIPLIIATLFNLVLQGIAGMIFAFISLYLSVAFSNSILLICEKNVSPLKSLLLSLRAANRKLFTLITLYTIMMALFAAAALFYGIFLIVVMPMFFHMKGIIYRNMFGITLKIVTRESDDDDSDSSEGNDSSTESSDNTKGSDIFNA